MLTLGLFIFVINGLLFWAVGSYLEGFRVSGFWSGVFGAIVYSLISWALSSLLLPFQPDSRTANERPRDASSASNSFRRARRTASPSSPRRGRSWRNSSRRSAR